MLDTFRYIETDLFRVKREPVIPDFRLIIGKNKCTFCLRLLIGGMGDMYVQCWDGHTIKVDLLFASFLNHY